MSTPTGKPVGPADPAGQASRTASDEANGSGKPDDEADAARSPYAPKRTRVRAVPSDSGDSGELPKFLAGVERARPQPLEPRLAANANDSLLRFDEPFQRASADRRPGEPGSGKRPLDHAELKAAEMKPKLILARDTASAARAAEGRKGQESDDDIERLEASLRWLKHQTADLRPAHPILAPGRRAADIADRGPVADDDGPMPHSLEPQNLMGPALMRAQRVKTRGAFAGLRGPFLILIAGLVAAPVAYFLSGNSTQHPTLEPKLAAVEPPPDLVEPSMSKPQQDTAAAAKPASVELPRVPVLAGAATSDAPAGRVRRAAAPKPAPQGEAVLAELPPSEPAPAPPARKATAPKPAPQDEALPAPAVKAMPGPITVRHLEPTEIKLLMQQGQQFISSGDVVAARVVFQRAAEAQDAAAALAMGATYDPLFLSKIGVLGPAADVEKARLWYERAKAFGSQEAPHRLELLANR